MDKRLSNLKVKVKVRVTQCWHATHHFSKMHPIQSLVNIGSTEQELCPKNELVRTDRYTERLTAGWTKKVNLISPENSIAGVLKPTKETQTSQKKKQKQKQKQKKTKKPS